MSKRIYLDNTATTRVRKEVIAEMKKYFYEIYANPSSIHMDGLIARGSIELARERIANQLSCLSEEIVFTGSGSEANNLALFGTAFNKRKKGKHIITSKIEHKSILNACYHLEERGYDVSYLSVNSQGIFNLKELEKLITKKTVLVSLGYVNNEIGNIQDIKKIINIVRKNKDIILHFDGVQALPYFNFNLSELDIDMMSFSGHKLYAPKGVGILYIKKDTQISPVIFGGEQEMGLRSGTENVPYIMGLSRAIQLNQKEKSKYVERLRKMQGIIINEVLKIPDVRLTGSTNFRAPNHTSFCFKGINGKMLIKELSKFGIEVSSGSACSSPKNTPSHVLEACGVPADYLYGGLRVTLGKYNNMKQVEYFLSVLPKVVERMRNEKKQYNNESIFISKNDFLKKTEAGEDIIILDVRPVKFPRQEIPGSVYVQPFKINSYIKKIDKNREIILVCFQGDIISPQIQQKMIKSGFKNVKVLKGGLFNYFGLVY